MLKPYQKAELTFDILKEIGQDGRNSRTYVTRDHQLNAEIVTKQIQKNSLNSTDEFFAESQLILIWGSNSIGSNLHFWRYAQQAKREGARLVCIDPRRSETADKCHEHLHLRPRTDAALGYGPK